MISVFSLYYRYFSGALLLDEYAIRRFFRIAPLYYILLTAYVLWTGTQASSDLVFYYTLTFNPIPRLTQGGLPASWTLGVEAVFYALFPIMLAQIRTARLALVSLGIAFVIGAITQTMIFKIYGQSNWLWRMAAPLHASAFVAGALCYLWLKAGKPVPKAWHLVVATALALVCLQVIFGWVFSDFPMFLNQPRQSGPYQLLHTFSYTIAFMPLLIAFASERMYPLNNMATIFLGKISYSVYLLHPLVIIALAPFYSALMRSDLNDLEKFFIAQGVTLAVLLPIGVASYKMIEKPGVRIGERICRLLKGRLALSAPTSLR